MQAILFVWVVSQSGRSLPGQSPGRLGLTVALDLANVLERDPHVDLVRYVHDQYAQYTHPYFVLMTDGRVITSGSASFPEPLLRMARAQLQRRIDRPDPRRPDHPDGLPPDATDRPERFGRGGDRFERDPSGMRFLRPSPILVNGCVAGLVVVPPRAPFGFLLGRFAPMLALVAGGVLILGAVLTSTMIFGPARRRLRALETAARQLGAGDLSARAPDRGGDEIAAVASAFNAMASDLSTRADALAASDRARRQLLADVSHELTTPVTAMRGYLETLAMPELALGEGTRSRSLSIISDETHRLERLVGELLDLARLEGGGGWLRIEEVPVAQLFDRVTRGTSTRRRRRAWRCRPRSSRARRRWRAIGIGWNRRFRISRRTRSGTRRAARPAAGDWMEREPFRRAGVALSVEDAGAAGIAAEHLPHIFDRFYKADAARPFDRAQDAGVSGGSGLGLSIVKAIVERHGGRISVASRPGRTVFEMVLARKTLG